jgi:hypothetical protein
MTFYLPDTAFMRQRNELDALLDQIRDATRQHGLRTFKAMPIWDDEMLTVVDWRAEDPDNWREFVELAVARNVPMLIEVAHAFHESVFEPTPREMRARLDPEIREQIEERDQFLVAARQFAGQTGRIEIGWIEYGILYQWHRETDWYSRVWELVSSGPMDMDDEP